jgi:hypothetical protein
MAIDLEEIRLSTKKTPKLTEAQIKCLNTALGIDKGSDHDDWEVTIESDQSTKQMRELEFVQMKFWTSRRIDARTFCIICNCSNTLF